jgi:hypothetical protein
MTGRQRDSTSRSCTPSRTSPSRPPHRHDTVRSMSQPKASGARHGYPSVATVMRTACQPCACASCRKTSKTIPWHGTTRYSWESVAKRTALAPGVGALAPGVGALALGVGALAQQPCELQLPVREPLALSCNMPTHVKAAGPAATVRNARNRRPSVVLGLQRAAAPSGVRRSQRLREGCCGLVYCGGHGRALWSRAVRDSEASRGRLEYSPTPRLVLQGTLRGSAAQAHRSCS